MAYVQDEIGVSLFDNDLESLLSANDDLNPDYLCAIEQFTDVEECYHMEKRSINTMQPSPVIKMQVIPTKFARPINVIVFLDFSDSFTIINPDILPP